MNTKLFRKSSIERVNSPEQLNEYMRVTNPSVWLTLAAIVTLLLGVVIWGVFGTVETTIETGLVVEEGTAICYVTVEDAPRLKAGMIVSAGSRQGHIVDIAAVPLQVDDGFSDYMLYLTGFEKGEFCYGVKILMPDMANGVYAAVITVDTTHPIGFIIH